MPVYKTNMTVRVVVLVVLDFFLIKLDQVDIR